MVEKLKVNEWKKAWSNTFRNNTTRKANQDKLLKKIPEGYKTIVVKHPRAEVGVIKLEKIVK